MQNEQIELVLKEYAKPFFGFAMSRTGDAGEAEEHSQEIAFRVVTALRRTKCVDKLNAYVWSVAHNTYKRWLALRHRSPLSLDDLTEVHGYVAPDNSSPEEMALTREASNLVRRERR